MAHLLHIDSSPLGDASVSRQLTAEIASAWTKANPGGTVSHLDVAATPLDHLTAELMQVVKFRNLDGLNDRQQQELATTDALVDQLLASDILVIGAPMFNFSVPSQLKTWIDRICQAGRTFRYTETGPVGMVTGKKAIIISTRGGIHSTNPAVTALDHQEAYLKTVLGFIGITDVTIIRAEGMGMGPAVKDPAIEAALADIANLF